MDGEIHDQPAPADAGIDDGPEEATGQAGTLDTDESEESEETSGNEELEEASDEEEKTVYIKPENDAGAGEESVEEAASEPTGESDEPGDPGVEETVDKTDDGSKADGR